MYIGQLLTENENGRNNKELLVYQSINAIQH